MVDCVGVLGLGSIGLRHARNFLELGCSVTGFDPDPSARAALAEGNGTPVTSPDAVLAACDAVVIATPSAQHVADLDRAVQAGRHVFIEKPLAHTDAGLGSILQRAEADGLVVFAALNQRFNPVIRAARQVVSDGLLGKVLWARFIAASYLPDWRPQQDYREGYAADPRSGGAMFDFIHEFDLAWHLFGPAKVVGAHARRTGHLEITSEDAADVLLCHEDGLGSSLHVDYVSRPRRRIVEAQGVQGYLSADLEGHCLQVIGADGQALVTERFARDANVSYVEEARAFLTRVRQGNGDGADGWEALHVLSLVIAARRMAGLPQA